MVKFINIENFRCKECNCKEYDCINLDPVICVCSKCGKQVSKDFKIEVLEVEE